MTETTPVEGLLRDVVLTHFRRYEGGAKSSYAMIHLAYCPETKVMGQAEVRFDPQPDQSGRTRVELIARFACAHGWTRDWVYGTWGTPASLVNEMLGDASWAPLLRE